MDRFKKLAGLFHKLTEAWAAVSVAGVLVMMFVTAIDVLLRKTTGKGLSGAAELASFGLCLEVMNGMAYTEMEHGHVNVTMFLRLMPRRVSLAILTLVDLCGAICAGTITYGVFSQAIKLTTSTVQGVITKIPYWPFYYIAGVGLVLFTISLLITTIHTAAAVFLQDEAKELTSGWQ